MVEAVTTWSPPRLISLGQSIFDPIWREKEHAGKRCEMLHVLRGRVRQEMRCGVIEAGVGDTIFTPAGMPHRDVFPPGSTFQVYIVHFDWDSEKQLLKQFTPMQLARVSAAAKAAIASDFRRMYEDFQRGGELARQLTSLRLFQILLTLYREAGEGAASRDQQSNDRSARIMEAARQVIHDRYHEALSLDDIADAVEVSPYHLSHVFSAEAGFTLSSYLTRVRMERAASLLSAATTVRRIADVAKAVGFRDAQYFSKVFSAHFGVTPSRYRRR